MVQSGTLPLNLPPPKMSVPAVVVQAPGVSGEYVLAVLDPANTAGEGKNTRAHNAAAVLIP